MKKIILTLIALIVVAGISLALTQSEKVYPKSDVDYPGFVKLTIEAEEHRKTHMVSLEDFLKLSKQKEVLVLDTRSEKMYKAKHIKGAVHLNFSDFTSSKLAKVIPSKETKVLIYCNNNLDEDEMFFARKSAPLALNIPTFINLYGYGYKNVYELERLMSTKNSPLQFEGAAVEL